jgi:predicted DNA-binding transcriptional regulator AlpA
MSTESATPRRLIDMRAAAKKAGCSTRHWLRLCDAGMAPPGVKLGALRRWDEIEIDAWIAAKCPPIDGGKDGN